MSSSQETKSKNSSTPKKNNSQKTSSSYNNTSAENGSTKRKNYLQGIITYGRPYIIKFFLIFLISALIIILPHDIVSHSINIATLSATLAIDTWITEGQSNFCLYNKFKGVHFAYWIVLLIVLVISAIIGVYGTIAQLNNENTSFESLTVILIVFSGIGLLSPIFELIYVLLDNATD